MRRTRNRQEGSTLPWRILKLWKDLPIGEIVNCPRGGAHGTGKGDSTGKGKGTGETLVKIPRRLSEARGWSTGTGPRTSIYPSSTLGKGCGRDGNSREAGHSCWQRWMGGERVHVQERELSPREAGDQQQGEPGRAGKHTQSKLTLKDESGRNPG